MALMPLTIFGLTACYMEVKDGEDDEHDGKTTITSADYMPLELQSRGDADTCEQQQSPDGRYTWYCYQSEDYTGRPSCKSSACNDEKVYTHYMLTDDLGQDRVVHVEAFDNPNFQGAPAGQVRIANFAARQGEWKDADLFLEPGEYYIRAYLTTDDDAIVPYSLGDMTLVSDQPVGVFGALSQAEMVRVAPRQQDHYPAPVHVYLDKKFEKPGAEPDTNAHLRLSLAIEDGQSAPDGRHVIMRLYTGRDLAVSPAADFSMASEMFLIQGRVGKAEFLTPSVKEGDYLVFAFIDANGNDAYDAGELAALHQVNQQPAAVSIKKNRTESLSLTLTTDAVAINP
jgi:hypothetical protein